MSGMWAESPSGRRNRVLGLRVSGIRCSLIKILRIMKEMLVKSRTFIYNNK